jgi:N-methylhydantoinase B
MTIDFRDQRTGGLINSGESGNGAARVAFKSLVAPYSPIDEGCFRPLKVIIPEGKILSATPPAPVGNWSRTLPTVIDLIFRALAPAMPERVGAGHKGDMGGYAFFGVNPKTGRRFLCQTIMGGGWGGRPHEDGENATVSMPRRCKRAGRIRRFTIQWSSSVSDCAMQRRRRHRGPASKSRVP